ncbi:MAG: hypothetical protein ACHQF0_09735 [Chitinophagales bacterium]
MIIIENIERILMMKTLMIRPLLFLTVLVISIQTFPQHTLRPYAGIHISGDAEMFYIGPSFQIGGDFQLKRRLLLSSYFQFFKKRVYHPVPFERGSFQTETAACLVQLNTGAKISRSFFIAGGICVQRLSDDYMAIFNSYNVQRTNVLPAVRIGYFFSLQKHEIAIELNAEGPYSYQDDGATITEIITQLSFGVRFIF